MNKKRILWSMAMLFVTAMLSVSLSSCGDDDGNEPTEIVSNQDPEGTIVLNMNNGASNNWYSIGLGTEIHIDDANNFDGYYNVEFVSVGKISGLSKITSIPSSGWSLSAAVVPGTGYVARYRPYPSSSYTYARLYVVDYIVGTTGGIIGATIKYQCPFQLPISLSTNSLTFTSEASSQTVSLKNPTSVTSIEGKPEWCTVNANENEITVSVTANMSAQQYTGTITLKNNTNSVKLNITQKAASSPRFEGGRGTKDDPFQVKTASQLENISLSLSSHFILTSDINMKSYLNANGSGWDPIGKSGTPFTGSFNGQGHTISGIWINRPTTKYIGLFGYTNNAIIKGVSIFIDGNGFNGQSCVSGICGSCNSGTISQCGVKGNIIAGDDYGNIAAGICGEARSNTTISECYSEGEIRSGYYACSIAYGANDSNISNCYSTVSMHSRSTYANGSKCYYAGKVDCEWFYCTGSYVYYNSDLIGDGASYISDTKNARSTSQMKTQSNYEGWDFTTIWKITEGKTYPTLRCFD